MNTSSEQRLYCTVSNSIFNCCNCCKLSVVKSICWTSGDDIVLLCVYLLGCYYCNTAVLIALLDFDLKIYDSKEAITNFGFVLLVHKWSTALNYMFWHKNVAVHAQFALVTEPTQEENNNTVETERGREMKRGVLKHPSILTLVKFVCTHCVYGFAGLCLSHYINRWHCLKVAEISFIFGLKIWR